MSVPRFIVLFLAVFACLGIAGNAVGLPKLYGAAMEKAVTVVGPAVNGCRLERTGGKSGTGLRYRCGNRIIPMLLQFDRLGLSLYPLLSLLFATPGMGKKFYPKAVLLGTGAMFLLDAGVALAYPWLVRPGSVAEVTGTFLGLCVFVGAPAILWFILTFSRLRGVWRL